jgi:hypothetical protein
MKKHPESYPLIPFVEDFISKSRTGKRLMNGGRRISPGSVSNYSYLLKHLRGYEQGMANPIRVRPFNKLNKQALVVEKT